MMDWTDSWALTEGYAIWVGCELMEGDVEPCRQDSFDVIALAVDGRFAAKKDGRVRDIVGIPMSTLRGLA